MENHVVARAKFTFPEGPCALAAPLFEEEAGADSPLLEEADLRAIARLREKGAVRGKPQEVYFLPSAGNTYDGVLLLGLGKQDACTTETVRRTAGKACETLSGQRVSRVVLDGAIIPEHVHGFIEGLMLGQYRFDRYKERKPDEPAPQAVEAVTIVLETVPDTAAQQCEQARIACECANWARDLANTPSNDLTPSTLAEAALEMAKEAGCEGEVLYRDRLEKLGMGALLGVARGSTEPPTLSVLRYTHEAATETLAFVGKGITFDTGGISIKPAQSMHEMKFDMCGAAAALGAFRAIAALKPAVNIVCVVPASENTPDGSAQKPGDVVRAYNGKTIEVHNTDAEGRLVLADALAYTVAEYAPGCVVDLATLTGACVVALGHYAAGMMTQDDALANALETAGAATGERVWRFPLWDDYDKLIEGTHADLCNIGPPKEAGVIIGGAFLKPFVGETPWAHLDIAGTAYGGKYIPYLDPKHATGYGVRLLTQWAWAKSRE
ncbi:MAG: leucyl aminopeptidase, partial [Candidatus Hydrogenedentota bacterium]